MSALADRFFTWVQRMFTCVDQLFCCWFRGFVYVWLNGECPSADTTLSDWIGQCAEKGFRAGLIAEKVVDSVLGTGHCRRAIITDPKD